MKKIIEFNPKDDYSEKIKQCDDWIEEDGNKLLKMLKNEPERYRPLITKLESITLFGARRQRLLEGGASND